MASSNLKLIIQKGPRNGETLEFNSRSKIRIGRVVKGNNLPIKDAGISSKHLEINFDSHSSIWVILDLDSSNGTIVNNTQLKPLSQFELHHGDEVKIGESTLIRVEVVEIREEIKTRRNPRRQLPPKGANDLGGKVEIREGIDDNRKNTRRRGASEISTDFGGESLNVEENVEVRGEVNNVENPRNKVEVVKEGCLNLEEEKEVKEVEGNRRGRGRGRPKKVRNLDDGNSGICENVENVEIRGEINDLGNPRNKVEAVKEGRLNLEEENEVKEVEGNRSGRGRGRPKKVRNLDDGNSGVCENVGNDVAKPEIGVSTRRTRNSKRVEDGVVSLADPMPTRRTRRARNVEDVGTSSVMESIGLDPGECKEVEGASVVDSKKTRGGRGRKKKVVAESCADVVAGEKVNHKVLQPFDESVADSPEQSVNDFGVKNDQLVRVEVSEPEGVALSMKEKHCPDLMDETNHVNAESSENVRDAVAKERMNHEVLEKEFSEKAVDLKDQPCNEAVDDAPRNSKFDVTQNEKSIDVEFPEQEGAALSMGEKQCTELMDEANNLNECVSLPVSKQDCVMGSSLVQEVMCDGIGDAMLGNGRTEELEIEEVEIESEANSYNRRAKSGTVEVADLDNMTLEDWFKFLEIHLPRQIHAAADEIIEDMIKRSKQFDEYVLQQQKEKSKGVD